MGMAPPQGFEATGLIGPIYAPDGSVLYDPQTDGGLINASKITQYPLVIGTDTQSAVTRLSAGSGTSVSSATGSIIIANTGVLSFNGRKGAVSPTSGDYTAAQVGALPASGTAVNSTQWGGANNDLVLSDWGPSYSTTSLSAVSTGHGVSLTPSTTRVLITVLTVLTNDTATDGAILYLYVSPTGIPAAGAIPGTNDTHIINRDVENLVNANDWKAATLQLLYTGLTAGTTYYWYLCLSADLGGTASIGAGSISIQSR